MTEHQSGVQAAPSLSTEELETRSPQPSSPDSVKLKPSGEQVAFWGQCQAGPGSPGASSWGTRGAFGRWARQEGASVPSLKTRKLYPTCCKVHFEGGFLLLCVAPVTVQLGMRLRGRCRKFREGWEKTGAGVPTSVLYQSEDHPPVSQEHQTSAVSSSERGDETGSNRGRRGKAAWLGAGCFLTGVGRSCPHILNPRSFPQRALCRSSVLCRSCLLSLTTRFLTQVLESKDLRNILDYLDLLFMLCLIHHKLLPGLCLHT